MGLLYRAIDLFDVNHHSSPLITCINNRQWPVTSPSGALYGAHRLGRFGGSYRTWMRRQTCTLGPNLLRCLMQIGLSAASQTAVNGKNNCHQVGCRKGLSQEAGSPFCELGGGGRGGRGWDRRNRLQAPEIVQERLFPCGEAKAHHLSVFCVLCTSTGVRLG